jgi:hypothetical protein
MQRRIFQFLEEMYFWGRARVEANDGWSYERYHEWGDLFPSSVAHQVKFGKESMKLESKRIQESFLHQTKRHVCELAGRFMPERAY